jgi:hypothetical protein
MSGYSIHLLITGCGILAFHQADMPYILSMVYNFRFVKVDKKRSSTGDELTPVDTD